MRLYCGLKDRLFVLGVGVCGLLAFSATLSANNTVLTLGNYNSATDLFYGSEYVGPYPGSIVPSVPQTDSLIVAAVGPIYCLDARQTNYFQTSYPGTEYSLAEVNRQDVEEAAFLASLMMYEARYQYGIDLTWTGSGASLVLNQTPSSNVSNFVNNVEGPISFAVWNIMGSPDMGPNPALTARYERGATAAYNKVLKNSGDPVVADFNRQVMVFFPENTSTQRFLTANLDLALIEIAAPEPGTTVLFATGVLLIALGSIRKLVRRPR